MALSSEDLVNWQLKTGMRGYLIPQVDELLDEVADELDRLHARIRELESEREAVKASLDDQLEVEETLRRTLYQAQKAADQTIEDAGSTAERIVADAQAEAEGLLDAARERGKAAYEDALREATQERAQIRASLEAEEARMRAVRSELRGEVDRLRAIESETRRLLRGLFEDRLNELDRPSVDLPSLARVHGDLDQEPSPRDRFDEAGPGEAEASAPSGAEARGPAAADDVPVDDVPVDDVAVDDVPLDEGSPDDVVDDLVVVVEPPSATSASSAPWTGPTALAEASPGDEGSPWDSPWSASSSASDAASESDDPDDPDESGEASPTADARDVGDPSDPHAADSDPEADADRPAYLGAVHDALATIQANEAVDALDDGRLGGVRGLREEDGEDDVESLFQQPPPRRRRRQG